jgi:hypothetical protein
VLGIGKKVSDQAANGIRTTRWTAEKPVSFPTIIFGDYLSAVSDHIVKKSDGTPIPVTVYVDKVSTNALDTRILDTKGTQGTQAELDEMRAAGASGARDIRGKQLGPIAVQAAVAIELYQKIYGVDYPYAKLDLVADPLGSFYGQAPSSIIYLGFGVFRGEGTVAAGGMFGGGANIAKFNKDVVAHETGHQWWGSVICNANQRNYWFVETLAELSSALYVEKVFGRRSTTRRSRSGATTVMKFDQVTERQNNYTVWAGDGRLPLGAVEHLRQGALRVSHLPLDVRRREVLRSLKSMRRSFSTRRSSRGTSRPSWKRSSAGTWTGFSTSGSAASAAAVRAELHDAQERAGQVDRRRERSSSAWCTEVQGPDCRASSTGEWRR